MECRNTAFFLGANSSNGFFSLFDELYDPNDGWRAYIIKGGPGTGKSGLMRKIADAANDRGIECEKIFCSSDPDSLDAVIIESKKFCIADGTAPHVMEPKYPGAVERIINLGEMWNSEKLFVNAQHIITVTNCNKALHRRSARYASAAAAALDDSRKHVLSALEPDKAEHYALRYITRSTDCKNGQGKEKRRFLSGVTPKGYVTLFETALTLCDKIVSVSDDNYASAGVLMEYIRRYAVANGIDVITCLNPFAPDGNPLHVILPGERVGFFTSNSLQNFKPYAQKNINAARFLNDEILSAHKQRLNFNRKAFSQFLGETTALLTRAKKVHDELESSYIEAMDYTRVDAKAEEIIKTVL